MAAWQDVDEAEGAGGVRPHRREGCTMNAVGRGLVVLVAAGALVAGGRVALGKAAGQMRSSPPPTTAQLQQLDARLAAQASQEEATLAKLRTQEQQLQATVAQLQQQAAAYQQQFAQSQGVGPGYGSDGRHGYGRRGGGGYGDDG
jgi:hypothetical protein